MYFGFNVLFAGKAQLAFNWVLHPYKKVNKRLYTVVADKHDLVCQK